MQSSHSKILVGFGLAAVTLLAASGLQPGPRAVPSPPAPASPVVEKDLENLLHGWAGNARFGPGLVRLAQANEGDEATFVTLGGSNRGSQDLVLSVFNGSADGLDIRQAGVLLRTIPPGRSEAFPVSIKSGGQQNSISWLWPHPQSGEVLFGWVLQE